MKYYIYFWGVYYKFKFRYFYRREQVMISKKRVGTKGFSLLEVVIAIPILAIASLVIIYSVMQTSMLSKVVSNKIAAKNISQSMLEKMTLDDYENVIPANYPSIGYESANPVYLDRVDSDH